MKKLMFAVAVAAGFAAFGDGLESANTVGYLNNGGTVAGLNMVGPGFQDVGLTSTKLMGLKVSNAQGGEVGTGTCVINLIDENGNTLKSYSWARVELVLTIRLSLAVALASSSRHRLRVISSNHRVRSIFLESPLMIRLPA